MSVRVSVRERISETARLLYAILLYVVTSPRSGYQRVLPQVLVLQNSLAYTTNTFRLTTLPSLLLFRVQNYSSPSSLSVPQPRPSCTTTTKITDFQSPDQHTGQRTGHRLAGKTVLTSRRTLAPDSSANRRIEHTRK